MLKNGYVSTLLNRGLIMTILKSGAILLHMFHHTQERSFECFSLDEFAIELMSATDVKAFAREWIRNHNCNTIILSQSFNQWHLT